MARRINHETIDETVLRDTWKTVKGGAAAAFAVKVAPAIALSLGCPPAAIIVGAAALGHGLLSIIARKTKWKWL